MEAFTNDFMSYFWYWFILMAIIIFGYMYYDTFGADKCKPKYRLDKDGYLQFYYRRFSRWEYFPIWNDNDDERKIEVHDKIRDLDYTLSYVGPGRAKIKYTFNPNAPITRDLITDYFRKVYPEFKNSEQLWKLHELYINKENTILNRIVQHNIFKSHEINI